MPNTFLDLSTIFNGGSGESDGSYASPLAPLGLWQCSFCHGKERNMFNGEVVNRCTHCGAPRT